MARIKYTDEERAAFLELAAEVGITRARRQLGYPHSWASGDRWIKAAGIEVPLDEIKAQAAAHYDWYKAEEALVAAEEGIRRVYETLTTALEITPDDQKKLAEALQKHTNTWRLLQDKATAINETQHKDSTDVELMQLLSEERMRNSVLEDKEDESYQDLDTVDIEHMPRSDG